MLLVFTVFERTDYLYYQSDVPFFMILSCPILSFHSNIFRSLLSSVMIVVCLIFYEPTIATPCIRCVYCEEVVHFSFLW